MSHVNAEQNKNFLRKKKKQLLWIEQQSIQLVAEICIEAILFFKFESIFVIYFNGFPCEVAFCDILSQLCCA